MVAAVRQAAAEGLCVRPVGAGHSFTPLGATDGIVVDLGGLAGVVDVDPAAGRATAWAGTRIAALGEPLQRAGLALRNQGDVDVQALAGAVGTGTHGTGPALASLSAEVVAARVVLASGDVVTVSPRQEPDLYQAARLSLGALGVVTQLTLSVREAYRLRERTWLEPTDACLARLPGLVAATRHFEFFWQPERDRCFAKALHPTDAPADPTVRQVGRRAGAGRLELAHLPLGSGADRFNEMEFALPAEAGPACFAELRTLFRHRHPDVRWPIEYRTQAADDLWISPARGRPTVTLSIHEGAERPYEALFRDAEAVFRNHGGRPHWGKIHWFGPDDLAGHHPEWDRFRAVRHQVDPEGRFLNDHLRRLLA